MWHSLLRPLVLVQSSYRRLVGAEMREVADLSGLAELGC
jgi:hypothetical protein